MFFTHQVFEFVQAIGLFIQSFLREIHLKLNTL